MGKHPDLLSLTSEERKSLPAKYHQPHWEGLGTPHMWICAVCWDDGSVTSWPCEVANTGNNGREIAIAGGLEYSW
jgi:hypothetical protein